MRLDVALTEQNPDTSRSVWQKHIKAGHITVDGQVKLSPKYDVSEGAVIEAKLPQAADFSDQKLPIVYLDDNVIVIDKPIGVLSHSKGALNDEFTVADFFSRYSDYKLDTNRPGIIHRLDRDTSGIMIGARNQDTAKLLQRQFSERKVKKTYLALIDGHLKEPTARIELPIERNPAAPSTFRVGASGKSAVTEYEVLDTDKTSSLVELRPLTGRTHQLRVHMSYLGTPIIGDRVYGRKSNRLYLHAHKLEITIPKGNRQVFSSPTPDEFKVG